MFPFATAVIPHPVSILSCSIYEPSVDANMLFNFLKDRVEFLRNTAWLMFNLEEVSVNRSIFSFNETVNGSILAGDLT